MSWDGFPQRKWLGYPPELWLGAAAYVVLAILAIPRAASSELAVGARVAIGLLPMLPLLLIAHGVYRSIRHQDELYRRIQLEAIAYAAGIVMFLSFLLGLLESMQLIPPPSAVWAGQALIVAWAIAAAFLNRRYG